MRDGKEAATNTGSLSIERLSTAERVADALREQLLSGDIAPGTPMRDAELSARAGVSRTTVREALSLLAREGLLTHSLHRGMEVARVSASDVSDIYAMRLLLECAGAEVLLTRAPAAVEALELAVQAMADAAARRDQRRVVEADEAFHTALVAALGNQRLQTAMRGAMKELRLVLPVADRACDDLEGQLQQHRMLLDRFRERDPGALQALEEHLLLSEAIVRAAVEEAETTHRERSDKPEPSGLDAGNRARTNVGT